MSTSEDCKKQVANDSVKVLKARNRLAKRLEAINMQITDKAIKNKRVEIYQWITRHSNQRIPLRLKSICIFDMNQNSAPISKIVENALAKIGALVLASGKETGA